MSESLSSASSASLLAAVLPRWVRTAGPAGNALSALLSRTPGAAWRVLPDGTVWAGVDEWPASDADYALLEDDASERRLVLASDELLTPGVTLDGRRLSHLVHTVTASSSRTECWLET